jgi:hypothetical protein
VKLWIKIKKLIAVITSDGATEQQWKAVWE